MRFAKRGSGMLNAATESDRGMRVVALHPALAEKEEEEEEDASSDAEEAGIEATVGSRKYSWSCVRHESSWSLIFRRNSRPGTNRVVLFPHSRPC
jgi:hypothetical protein